jgi:hypothetical protein
VISLLLVVVGIDGLHDDPAGVEAVELRGEDGVVLARTRGALA